ncbi:MAG: transcription termination/antitermination protein NusA [bacterium JZ-2024 1]
METKTEIETLAEDLARKRSISLEMVEEALKESLKKAYQEHYRTPEVPSNLFVEVDLKRGNIRMYLRKMIVRQVKNPQEEIAHEEVVKRMPHQLPERYYVEEIPLEQLSLRAFHTAVDHLVSRVEALEREQVEKDLRNRINQIVRGKIYRVDPPRKIADRRGGERTVFGNVWMEINKVNAILPWRHQIPTEKEREKYKKGKELEVLLLELVELPRGGIQGVVSRAHPLFLQRLMEREIPEVASGQVQIVNIVRKPGVRAKVAVRSDVLPNPVLACLGVQSKRIKQIRRLLSDESIDVILYDEDPRRYILNALSPVQLDNPDSVHLIVTGDSRFAIVEIPDKKMEEVEPTEVTPAISKAIGKRGINARLASQLTGWSITLKRESEFKQLPDMPLEKTGLKPEIVSRLTEKGLIILRDLFPMTDEELRAILGEEYLEEVKKYLIEIGIYAPEEEETGEVLSP